jgi:hypothetical protein
MNYSMPRPLLGLCEFPARWEMPLAAALALAGLRRARPLRLAPLKRG